MNELLIQTLLPSPQYFPISRGIFEMAPGMFPLGSDFGNGVLDKRLFQLTSEFFRYRQNKLICRQMQLGQYYQRAHFDLSLEEVVCLSIIQNLTREWPDLFLIAQTERGYQLECRLTEEKLFFTNSGRYIPEATISQVQPVYQDGLDALACQVQEDLTLMVRNTAPKRDWAAAIHLCSPEGWSAEEKCGLSFEAIHLPVPDIDRIARRSDNFMELMINKGPFTRFVWGLNGDNQLNHHPKVRTKEMRLGKTVPARYLRVERQVTWGLPAIDAALFTIAVYFYDLQSLAQGSDGSQKMALLKSAILSMREDHLRYRSMNQELRLMIIEQLPRVPD